MTKLRQIVLCLSIALAGCGGATPRVIAYDALWHACQEVKEEIDESRQSADARWLQLNEVDNVCIRLGKKVLTK